MAPFDFEQLRREMAGACRLTFSAYRKLLTNEQIYAYALCADGSGKRPTPAINTKESLNRALDQYIHDDETVEMGVVTYCPEEWGYRGAVDSVTYWGPIWDKIDACYQSGAHSAEDCQNGVAEAMIGALRDLDQKGFFGTDEQRAEVTVLVWMTDLSKGRDWWIRSVRELNPAPVVDAFLSEVA